MDFDRCGHIRMQARQKGYLQEDPLYQYITLHGMCVVCTYVRLYCRGFMGSWFAPLLPLAHLLCDQQHRDRLTTNREWTKSEPLSEIVRSTFLAAVVLNVVVAGSGSSLTANWKPFRTNCCCFVCNTSFCFTKKKTALETR